ncbi:beta-ketoacyl synthase N-terminal-like domain-containing protein [Actinomycetes bacterium KLBMP 9797]
MVITGVGAVSAAGLGAGALWDAVAGGRVLTGPITRYDLSGYPTQRAAEVPPAALSTLDDVVPAHDSLAGGYLAAASLEALAQAGIPPRTRRERVGVFAGTVMGTRPVHDRDPDAPAWARPAELLAPLRDVVTVDGPRVLLAPGCAAGNAAVAAGRTAVAAGEVDVAICGGTDELSLEVFAFFTAMRALAPDTIRPFDAHRRGTMPGEGAGVLVLESATRAARRGARPLARVLACASAADAFSVTQPHPDGAGLAATIHACLARAGRAADEVDWVCAHGTGTRANDGVEARAVAKALAGRRRPVLSSVKGQLGHAEGGAAALEAVIAVRALTENLVPGNATLIEPDPECGGVDLVPPGGRRTTVDLVLSQAYGFGGAVCTILLGGIHG